MAFYKSRVYLQYFYFILLFLTLFSCGETKIYHHYSLKYKIGDNSVWGDKNWDDNNWAVERGDSGDSIFWARLHFTFNEIPESLKPYGISISSFGDYEAYWDGVLIGRNGIPGEEEKLFMQSKMDRYFVLPDSLATKGDHVLAIRASQMFFSDHERTIVTEIGEYPYLLRKNLVLTAFMHILAGAFLIAAFYYLILYMNNKKAYPTLLFSLACFLFFMLIVLEYIKYYLPIHYSDFYLRLGAIGILTFLISFLIPVYFTVQFSLANRRILVLGYFILLLSIYLCNLNEYDYTAELLGLMMWSSSTLILCYAVYKNVKGAGVVLIGLGISALINYFLIYDLSLFLSFTILLLCMLYILAIRIQDQKKAYEFSMVQCTRLRNQLLKMKIQPHFLMNTLTSLIDWVEESPEQGVSFIEALADEFHLFNQIEDHTLIPIGLEIKLCKNHLNIMKYRKELDYQWEDEEIEEGERIPPAVIHTLVENGITHTLPSEDGSIKFKLRFGREANLKRYTLQCEGVVRQKKNVIKEGTGFQYVKSRLTESYGDGWEFTSGLYAQGWINKITIYNN